MDTLQWMETRDDTRSSLVEANRELPSGCPLARFAAMSNTYGVSNLVLRTVRSNTVLFIKYKYYHSKPEGGKFVFKAMLHFGATAGVLSWGSQLGLILEPSWQSGNSQ